MRTSAGEKDVVNGCTDTSMRPCTKPRSRTISSLSATCAGICAPPLSESGALLGWCGEASTRAISGLSVACTSANSSSHRLAVMPGSYSLRATSYSSASSVRVTLATSAATAKHSASIGAKEAKSSAARALVQAAYAELPSLAFFSASSAGILVMRSKDLRASRTMARSRSSWRPSCSACAISAPRAASVERSWMTDARVASWSPRSACVSSRSGIITS